MIQVKLYILLIIIGCTKVQGKMKVRSDSASISEGLINIDT